MNEVASRVAVKKLEELRVVKYLGPYFAYDNRNSPGFEQYKFTWF